MTVIRRITHNCLHLLWNLLVYFVGFTMEIVGGKEVPPHSRPFMASIQSSGHHICGGVLIHPQWVLTAAHCRYLWVHCAFPCVSCLQIGKKKATCPGWGSNSLYFLWSLTNEWGLFILSHIHIFCCGLFFFGARRASFPRQVIKQTQVCGLIYQRTRQQW